MPAHTLIWKHSTQRPVGTDGLLGWLRFDLPPAQDRFRHAGNGQVCVLALRTFVHSGPAIDDLRAAAGKEAQAA